MRDIVQKCFRLWECVQRNKIINVFMEIFAKIDMFYAKQLIFAAIFETFRCLGLLISQSHKNFPPQFAALELTPALKLIPISKLVPTSKIIPTLELVPP